MCGIFALINGDVDPVKDTLLRHIENICSSDSKLF